MKRLADDYTTKTRISHNPKIKSMIPGRSRILTCPFCGEKKVVMTVLSGNTFGAEYWSDNKMIAPMPPEVSYIQKCPHCKKYYITARQEMKMADNGFSMETGTLTFPEMKEAFAQLSGGGFQEEKEEVIVRWMLHHAYNDHHYRGEHKVDANKEDRMLFKNNAIWLITNSISDNLLKAEFYREIGEYDVAYDLLKSVEVETDFQKVILSDIQKRVESKDCEVFKIK